MKGGGKMIGLSANNGSRLINMHNDQVLAFKARGRRFEISCLTGMVWLTDGMGGDRIIKNGQQLGLRSKGKICIQAFAPSMIRIQWEHTVLSSFIAPMLRNPMSFRAGAPGCSHSAFAIPPWQHRFIMGMGSHRDKGMI